jgi:hypothetical protein
MPFRYSPDLADIQWLSEQLELRRPKVLPRHIERCQRFLAVADKEQRQKHTTLK